MSYKSFLFAIVGFILGVLTAYTLIQPQQPLAKSIEIENLNENIASRITEQVQSVDSTPDAGEGLHNNNQQVPVDIQSEADRSEPSLQQELMAEQIMGRLNNPYYIENHTYLEAIEGLYQLPEKLKAEVGQEMARLFGEGRLELGQFKPPEFPRYETLADGAPLPDPVGQLAYENIVAQFENNLGGKAVDLAILAKEAKTLPPQLKQELADKFAKMINSGEINLGEVLGQGTPVYVGESKNVKVFID